jgi:hypothetical protein
VENLRFTSHKIIILAFLQKTQFATVPAIKIASPMLDTGIFQFAALKRDMDMDA